jgi:hypothetical protein
MFGISPALLAARSLPWTPAEIVTKLWLDASDSSTITLDSGKVSVWADKSGNGYNFTQSTSTKRPGITTLNGLDAVDFDGTDDFLTASSALLTNNMSMYIVTKPVRKAVIGGLIDQYGTGSYPTLCCVNTKDSGGASTGEILYWNNSSTNGAGWGGRIKSFDFGSNTFLYGVYQTPSYEGTSVYWNGFLQDTGTMSSVTGSPNTKLGVFNSTNFLEGPIAEVIITAPHAAGTREKVEGYAAHKWGFAGDLDSGHPYKSAPPVV